MKYWAINAQQTSIKIMNRLENSHNIIAYFIHRLDANIKHLET